MNKPAPTHLQTVEEPLLLTQPVQRTSDLANTVQQMADENAALHMENARLVRDAEHLRGQVNELRLANSQLALESKTDREAAIQAATCVETAYQGLEAAKLAMPATGVLDNVKTDIGSLARLAHGTKEDGPLTREETK